MKKWETGRSNTGRGEERRESSQRPSAFSTVITRNLPGPVRPWEERDALPTSHSQQSCSNLFVEVPAVAKLNLNGQMSLLTRTERSVSFPNVTSSSQYPPHRTTSAIALMPLLVGGRKERTSIGTIVNTNYHKKSVRKRYVR